MRNWEECEEEKFIKNISPDIDKSLALKRIAINRINFLNNKTESKYLNFIFEGYYSSIVELIHSIAIKKGYKISNHTCLKYFLSELLNQKELSDIYDFCRYKRNSLVYYGYEMDAKTVKETIKNAKKIIKQLLNY